MAHSQWENGMQGGLKIKKKIEFEIDVNRLSCGSACVPQVHLYF